MGKRYEVHTISHTHWDREWYLPFQLFRFRLVDLIDHLLDILDKDQNYTHFHLDGQTIVLQDYLELRPEKRDVLKKYIQEGRILVGPWYILPDEFLVSGEATIRNLLLGHRVSREFGQTMKVGYVPDCFGHISQLPQVFAGFGLDTALLWRGIGGDIKSEFYWEAPDGSRVLTIHMPDEGGYCYGADLPADPEKLRARLRPILDLLIKHASTQNLLLMNGCDHLEPQPDLSSILATAAELFPDMEFKHSSLIEYIQKVREAGPSLDTFKGELRDNQFMNILAGTISTRMYLKQVNFEVERLMERWAEPMAAIMWSKTGCYPRAHLWKAWEYLLQNHPHDSICGCSVDPVHEQMMTRFAWAREMGEEIVERCVDTISATVESPVKAGDEVGLFIYNALGWKRTDVVTASVDIPWNGEVDSPAVRDPEGRVLPCQVMSVEDTERLVVNPWARPRVEKIRRLTFSFLAEDVPACGYKIYAVTPQGAHRGAVGSYGLSSGPNWAENEFLKVEISEDGSLVVTDKSTGARYSRCNMFEDSGDAGDEYTYSYPLHDTVFFGMGEKPVIALVENGPVKVTFKIAGVLKLPEGLTHDRRSRSENMVACDVVSYVTLTARSRRLNVVTEFDNRVRDHRLRVLFPSGISSSHSYAGSPFDVVARPVKLPPAGGWVENPTPTHPFREFVDVSDGERGLTIAAAGLTEYEVKDDGQGTIALTLLRCVDRIARFDLLTRKGRDGYRFHAPGGQCLGRHSFAYSIIPHQGTWRTELSYIQAFAHNVPLLARQVWPQSRLYHSRSSWVAGVTGCGEVTAAGAAAGAPEGTLASGGPAPACLAGPAGPPVSSFISIEPAHLVLSALKRAEDKSALVIRVYNLGGEEVEGRIRVQPQVRSARLANLAEEPVPTGDLPVIDGHEVRFKAGPAAIVTLELSIDAPQREEPEVWEPYEKIAYMTVNGNSVP
ncbi:MAG: hypothetical protein HPY71_09755 [Firmicutes bacterium]|nr:hypothetical protein [Bacillota bacterium]